MGKQENLPPLTIWQSGIGIRLYNYRVENIRVIDGDTVEVDIDLGFDVWLKKQKVRIHNIDAPEIRSKDKEEKVFAQAAKKRMEELLSIEEDIILRSFQDVRGKFGRIIGDFVIYDLAGTCADALCTEGYAVRCNDKTKEQIKQEHLKNRKILIESSKVKL